MMALAEAELFPANGILMPLIDSIKKSKVVILFFAVHLQARRWLSYLIIDIFGSYSIGFLLKYK